MLLSHAKGGRENIEKLIVVGFENASGFRFGNRLSLEYSICKVVLNAG